MVEPIKVAKAPLLACLSCPLCGSLVEEATTICECLHTFCRDCIEQRLSEDVNCCPICDVYLGCTPLDKLRADPQLDEVRNKLFASSSRKRKGTPRRKERTLSSLGLSSVPSTSRRAPSTRIRRSRLKNLAISSSSNEDRQQRSDIRRRGPRKSSSREESADPSSSENTKGKSVEQTPLDYLAELADAADAGSLQDNSLQNNDEKSAPVTRRYGKLSRPTRGVVRRQQQRHPSIDTTVSSRSSFVWFALKPAEDQSEGLALPTLSAPYLRVNDGQVPVSVVKKYLAAKLELKNEGEVEITCCNQPLVASLPLAAVRDTWLSRPRQNASGAESSSCTPNLPSPSLQQVVVTLKYRRKVVNGQ